MSDPAATPPGRQLARPLRGHSLWAVADQVLSSATNFALIALVANTSEAAEFGAFALAYATYGLTVGTFRAVGGEILLLRAARDPASLPGDAGRLQGLAAVLGLVGGALTAAAGLAVSAPLGAVLLAMGAALPAVLLQDSLRYCLFAAARPRGAVLLDAVWAALVVVLLAGVVALGARVSAPGLVLLWGAACALSLAVGWRRVAARPRMDEAHRWVTLDRTRVLSSLADFAFTTGAFLLAVQLIGLVAGLVAVAAIQGAQLLFAPFSVLVSGARIVLLPRLARAARRPRPDLRREARRASMFLYLAAAAWAGAVLFTPDALGTALLGATWSVAAPILSWTALYWLARTGALPALDGLRALGAGRRLVLLRATSGVLILCAAVAGSALDGAPGAAAGLAVALLVSAALWWDGLRRDTRSVLAPGSPRPRGAE